MRSILFLLFQTPLLAQWAALGPFGGPASVVVADPQASRAFLAGTRNALLFRSRDAGETWTPVPFPAQLQATLNSLAVDPQVPGVYLAALSSDLPQYSGILRSKDAGATWRQVPELRNQHVYAIAFARSNSRLVAAGTESGVFASSDGGSTWRRISPAENPQLRPVVSLTFDPEDPATIYAGTPHLPWKTNDFGISWTSAHIGMLDDSDVFSIRADRNQPSRVFAGACSGIYRTLNGGATWTRLIEARDASSRTYVIGQDPHLKDFWFAGTTQGIVRSVDGGATWHKVGPHTTRSIAFDPRSVGRMLIATDEAGILRSDDAGQTWFPENAGFCNRRISALWTASGAAYAAITDGAGRSGAFRLAPDLRKWTYLAVPPRFPSAGDPPGITTTSSGMLKATTSGLKFSEDQGLSWHSVRGPLESDSIQAICRHPRNASLLFAAKFGLIFVSTDAGRSWKCISPDPWPISSVAQLAILPGTPDRLMVLTVQQGIWALPLDRW